MCGIFGFAKTSNGQSDHQLDILKRTFTNLTDESSARGKDSTGFSIMNPLNRYTYKTLTDSSTLTRTNEWSNVIDKIDRDTSIVLGHTRFATTGAKVVTNAHPFNIGEVVGIHNGVIYNFNQVARGLGKAIPQVDSEVIFQSLNRKDKSKAFESINGDFAVAWAKENNTTLHLAREDGRPMVISYWKKAKVLFFASTEDIMSNAMLDAGLVLDIIKVPTDIIYSYDTSKFTKLVDYKEEKFKTISQDTIDDYGYGFNYGYGGWHTKYSTKTCDTTYENDIEDAYCMTCGDYSWSQGYCAEHLPADLVSNMSPASKALHVDKIDYCEVCFEDTVDDELEYDADMRKYVCIDCEWDIPNYDGKLLTDGGVNEEGNTNRVS
jgi:predicted glutamine amidotransferase